MLSPIPSHEDGDTAMASSNRFNELPVGVEYAGSRLEIAHKRGLSAEETSNRRRTLCNNILDSMNDAFDEMPEFLRPSGEDEMDSYNQMKELKEISRANQKKLIRCINRSKDEVILYERSSTKRLGLPSAPIDEINHEVGMSSQNSSSAESIMLSSFPSVAVIDENP